VLINNYKTNHAFIIITEKEIQIWRDLVL